MIRAKYRIPALFFMLAAAIVATDLLLSRAQAFAATDLYVHGTYYVVSHTFVFWVLSVYFVACSLLYLIFEKVARRRMSLRLGHVHFWLSAISVGILLYLFHKMQSFGTDAARAQAAMHSLAELGFAAFFSFLAAQIVFFVNILSRAAATKATSKKEAR